MEKTETGKRFASHDLKIVCREKGTLTGIEKVISSCDTSLQLISACGQLYIGGEKLKIVKYNADDGTLEFEGVVGTLKYTGAKQPLLKRLFK